jgi:hypothetical protein
LTSHGISVGGFEHLEQQQQQQQQKAKKKKSVESLGIGLVKPKIPDIGIRLTRRFSRTESLNNQSGQQTARKLDTLQSPQIFLRHATHVVFPLLP